MADREYDVCLSFAGEDRDYVKDVAALLNERGVRVFYDEYEKAKLWGKDLYDHLSFVYRNAARYCVLFVSEHYANKVWTNHERKNAQSRALSENSEYILPARFDDTVIDGLSDTVGFVDLRDTSPTELVNLISQKLGPRHRGNYFPPHPDRLFKALGAKGKRHQSDVQRIAYAFFRVMSRMTAEERVLIHRVFANSCPAELPDNVHINLDLLRRVTGTPIAEIVEDVSHMASLGFFSKVRDGHDDEQPDSDPYLVLEWHYMSGSDLGGNHTLVAAAALSCATDHYCDDHGKEALRLLDFGQLSTVSFREDAH